MEWKGVTLLALLALATAGKFASTAAFINEATFQRVPLEAARDAGDIVEALVAGLAWGVYDPFDRARTFQFGPYTFRIEGNITQYRNEVETSIGLTVRF